jgi:hypothetical protein
MRCQLTNEMHNLGGFADVQAHIVRRVSSTSVETYAGNKFQSGFAGKCCKAGDEYAKET